MYNAMEKLKIYDKLYLNNNLCTLLVWYIKDNRILILNVEKKKKIVRSHCKWIELRFLKNGNKEQSSIYLLFLVFGSNVVEEHLICTGYKEVRNTCCGTECKTSDGYRAVFYHCLFGSTFSSNIPYRQHWNILMVTLFRVYCVRETTHPWEGLLFHP